MSIEGLTGWFWHLIGWLMVPQKLWRIQKIFNQGENWRMRAIVSAAVKGRNVLDSPSYRNWQQDSHFFSLPILREVFCQCENRISTQIVKYAAICFSLVLRCSTQYWYLDDIWSVGAWMTWWPLGDHLVITWWPPWWPLGDHLGTAWVPLGYHLGTT